MISHKPTSAALAALAFTICLSPAHVAAKRIKCWTNSDGIRECGYKVPPEYAQQGHEVLSKHGTVIEEQERAKTPEELERERAERERREKEEAERKRIAEEQAARDRVLLATFTTEEDLELARQGKLQVIDTQTRHAENRVANLQENLDSLEEEAAGLERSGKQVPEDLQNRIEAVQRQVRDNEHFIAERRRERVEVNDKFDKDLERYRELKAMGRR